MRHDAIKTDGKRKARDERMSQILTEGREVLRESGSEQFLTAAVASRCGVSEGTIYKYFPTKRSLLIQIAEAWLDEFLAEDFPARTSGPVKDRLHLAVWWALSFVSREPVLSRFILMDLRADPAYRSFRAYQQNREIVRRVAEVLEDGMQSGELRSDVPLRLVRNMIFGAIEHETWALLRGSGAFSVDESAEGITEVILRGLAVPKPDASPDGDVVARLEAAVTRLEQIG